MQTETYIRVYKYPSKKMSYIDYLTKITQQIIFDSTNEVYTYSGEKSSNVCTQRTYIVYKNTGKKNSYINYLTKIHK
jgi:hypothetical protein